MTDYEKTMVVRKRTPKKPVEIHTSCGVPRYDSYGNIFEELSARLARLSFFDEVPLKKLTPDMLSRYFDDVEKAKRLIHG